MAVIYSMVHRPFPGKQGAMIARMNQTKSAVERLGGDARIFQNLAGGSNSTMFVLRYEDMADFAAKFAIQMQDPELQAIQAAISESPNADVVSTDIWIENA